MNDLEFHTRIGTDGILTLRVPLDPADADAEVIVTVKRADEQRGSPQAIMEALRKLPPINPAYIDDLNRSIAEGALPVTERGVFESETESPAADRHE